MSSKYEKTLAKLEQLMQYADLDGTEWGEMCQAMQHLYGSYSDYIGEDLRDALEKNIAEQLKWAESEMEITEVDETFTRKVKVLEMK
jgi:hypothetical protein